MAQDSWIDCHTEPKGKRTVRRNRYGILKGYIGRTQWESIDGPGITPYSDAETKAAEAWIAGREDWHNAPWD